VCALRAARNAWQVTGVVVAGLLVLGVGGWHIWMFARTEYTPNKFQPNPLVAEAVSLAAGQRVYQAHCVECHDLAGQGRGILAHKLLQPPLAFIVSVTAAHSDGDLFHWIQHGRPGTAMPAFAGHLSLDDTWQVVHYIRHVRGEK
jgi:mono/diheme cytochrome c family protein